MSKCDNCSFKKTRIGAGAPDDYSVEYCSKGHWDNSIVHDGDWSECIDFDKIPDRCVNRFEAPEFCESRINHSCEKCKDW
jgi:hypothetical protein